MAVAGSGRVVGSGSKVDEVGAGELRSERKCGSIQKAMLVAMAKVGFS